MHKIFAILDMFSTHLQLFVNPENLFVILMNIGMVSSVDANKDTSGSIINAKAVLMGHSLMD